MLNGNFDVTAEFFAKRLQVNDENDFNSSALHLASYRGKIKEVKELIEKGAAVNTCVCKYTPLHLASSFGHIDVAKFLIENGAEVNMSNEDKKTPLHLASAFGHLQVVQWLIENGAEVNALMEASDSLFSSTPLQLASFGGHTDVAALLIEKGGLIETGVCIVQSFEFTLAPFSISNAAIST